MLAVVQTYFMVEFTKNNKRKLCKRYNYSTDTESH
jgi:hypothetical protein